MEEEGLNQVIYSKSVVEFVTVANEYCHFIERINVYSTSHALSIAQKILPLVYLKAALLPEIDKILEEETEKFVSELDYTILLQNWMKKLGGFDSFKEVFKPGMEFSDEALESSISENLLDIYQDLKNFISSYSLGNEDVMNDSLSECVYQFREYWGQRLVNVLRAIHMLLMSGAVLENSPSSEKTQQNKNESGWVDGFFDQFRSDKF